MLPKRWAARRSRAPDVAATGRAVRDRGHHLASNDAGQDRPARAILTTRATSAVEVMMRTALGGNEMSPTSR